MDSGVEYYSLDELENVGEKIKSLVADVGSMKEKVARGVQDRRRYVVVEALGCGVCGGCQGMLRRAEAWRLRLLVR